VAGIWRRDGEALARLEVPKTIASQANVYPMHPALLDSCFQVLASAMPRSVSEDAGLYLPVGAGRVDHRKPASGSLWVHARITSATDDNDQKLEGEICVSDLEGDLVVDIKKFAVQRLALANVPADRTSEWLFTSVWRRQDRSQKSASSTSLILVGTGQRTVLLRDALIERGERCVAGSPETLAELLREARNAPMPIRHIVYLAEKRVDDVDPAVAAQARCTEVLHLVQSLAQAGFRDPPRLWLVTRGTQPVSPLHDMAGLDEAPLWGLASTIALEHPELACSRIDLSPTPSDDEPEQLAQELCAEQAEDQIALRPDGRYVARLVRLPGVAGDERQKDLAPAGERQFKLEIATPGVLDNLTLRAAPRQPPAAGEIEIQVQAAGLNFLDVMSAMGLRPGDDAAPILLGGECAGVVSALGEGVHEFQVGDSVIAIAPSSFGRFVTTPADFATPKPDRLSDVEGATIPIAFLTAYYALHEVGRIQTDERILIHSASGGTGLAAVQLAQRAGAEIFATAGSPEKREFLRSLGVPHVMNSRSLDFAVGFKSSRAYLSASVASSPIPASATKQKPFIKSLYIISALSK
jgi:hypothetical protein